MINPSSRRLFLALLFSPGGRAGPARNDHARALPGLSAFSGPEKRLEKYLARSSGAPCHRRAHNIRIVGGIFILYLARGLFLNLRNSEPVTTPPDNAARQSFVNAVVMNALNPNPFIFWGVVAGPILLSGWRESPGLGISFMIGFYGTFVCSLAALILVFATAGRVNPKINRLLSFFAGSGLLAFGIYQMVTGLMAVIGGR
jgi:hypothetical protein